MLAFAALSPCAAGQEVLWKADGAGAGDGIGWRVAIGGDSDGDGLRDIVVGSISSGCNGTYSGRGLLLRGTDGVELQSVCGTQGWLFGEDVAGNLDVDGDGVGDFLVTAVDDDRGAPFGGSYSIYSGVDAALLREELGTYSGQGLGLSAASIRDLDGDGARDYMVASFSWIDGQAFVTVYSGISGAVIRVLGPVVDGFAFGWSVADAGDVNADGITDLLVGDDTGDGPTHDHAGMAWVFSGSDGSVIHSLEGEQDFSEFGVRVDGVGDIDQDGHDDIIVGAQQFEDSNGSQRGKTYVFSGTDGALLFSHVGSCLSGADVSGAGDVNFDGYLDYLAADPSGGFGCAEDRIDVYSGRNGLVLYHWENGLDAGPVAIDGGVDLDTDGRIDVVAGFQSNDEAGTDAGAVFVYSLERFFCDATPKTTSPQRTLVEMSMGQTDPGKLIGLALVGFDGVPTFSFLVIAPADSLGRLLICGNVPLDASGHTADFQAFAVGFNGRIVASAVETLVFN